MNHNYYYTLLGSRAGGPGTSTPAGVCTDSLQLRYSYIQEGGGWVGAQGDGDINDWWSLVGGEFAQVWPSSPTLEPGTRLYLDSGLSQEIGTLINGNWYRVDSQLLRYDFQGIAAIETIAQPEAILVRITQPSSTQCNLQGPYNQTVWVQRDEWQQVDRIWLDQALSDPFVGGGSWYHVFDNDIPSGGTTLQVNDCGWVIGYFAC
jgi:hypothetical protein